MEVEDRAALQRRGCILLISNILVGMAIGITITLSIFGMGFEQLWAQINGQSQWVLVDTGPKPEEVSMIGGAAPGRRLLWRQPIPLDTDTPEPDLLMISRNYDRETDTLVYFSPSEQKVRWESPPLGDNGNSWAVTTSADHAIIGDKDRLIGLNLSDGSIAWEAPLTDEVSINLCDECLKVFGDSVIALTADGTLQAFDRSSGAPLWSKRLREAVRQIVDVNGLVGVPDQVEDRSSGIGLYLYTPESGELAGQIGPQCSNYPSDYGNSISTPSLYDPILRSPDGSALYWVIDSYEPCLVRVDPTSGEVVWRSTLPGYSDSWLDVDDPVFYQDTMYLADLEHIFAISDQGEVSTILQVEEYDLDLLAVNKDSILAWAKRTRGTSRIELWLIDASTGERRWERVVSGSAPIADTYSSGDLAAMMIGDSVALIEHIEEPETYFIESIGIYDGVSKFRSPIRLENADTSIRGVTWGRSTIWLAADELYAVDITSGNTLYRWP